MLDRASLVADDPDARYLVDATLYHSLPAYSDLVDAAVSAEMDWLTAKSAGQAVVSRQLLEAYTASLVPRRCRLFGKLLACSHLPNRPQSEGLAIYVRIRLAARSLTYRDQIYECHYAAPHPAEGASAIGRDLLDAKIGDDVRLFGWLERSFCVPGFYLARARMYQGPHSV